ncbi:hypothetical protein CRYUN_Cryun19dG0145100 [Craigia yunnanensis]
MWEAKVCSNVANELQRVVDSCMNIAVFNILNQDCANQVQGHHVVEIEGGQLRLAFPQNSIQINQKGKNAEVANQEMIVQEKQGNEVILTLQQVEGRLAGLKLAMKITNQDMKDLPAENCGSSLNLESISKYLMEGVPATNLDEGTSNAATNEANVKLSPDETRIVRGYKVFNRNADVLDEIFQKHPNIVKNFRLAHLQSLFMNSLAEVYQKIITSKQEMLELNDIEIMELMVGDMEHNGLQLTWLNEMLKEVRERLEQEKKKLQGEIDMYKAKTKEAERRMAKLEKKPRLE